jgi:decaprenyl-phosphate phosphoribosyltransferase
MLAGLIRTMRPHQWVKNLFVFTPLVFAGQLFVLRKQLLALAAFACFCGVSSAVYILNDLADIEADRSHPVKRHRPIASGKVSVRAARRVAHVLLLLTIGGGTALDVWFGLTIVGYLLLNLAYSARLKRIAYVDVLCIALGFELRVLGGAISAAVHPSAYLVLATFWLASFLGFGKRTHELMQGDSALKQRSALRAYSASTLTALLYLTGAATLVTYVVYTLDLHTRLGLGTDWLILTVPFALFGLLRFLQLVRTQPDVESPTEQMLRDKPFLFNFVAWGAAVVTVLYFT